MFLSNQWKGIVCIHKSHEPVLTVFKVYSFNRSIVEYSSKRYEFKSRKIGIRLKKV